MSTSSSFSTTPDTTAIKRQHNIASVPSMDNISLPAATSPLTEFYYK
jgi:hypothetical protein